MRIPSVKIRLVRYRDDLEAHGCPGARKDDEARTYFRYICDVDIVNNKQQILGLFDIFHNQVVRVVIDPFGTANRST